MNELLLIVTLAGEKAALRAADVESVAELERLTPVPCAPSHIAGLTALRSRVLTVIDCGSALGFEKPQVPEGGAAAAVVAHDGHPYALLLDSVEGVTEARSAPAPLGVGIEGGWARMSHGTVETAEGLLLLLNVAALVAGRHETAAA